MSIVLERDVDLTYKQWFEEERSFKDDDPIASNCEYKSFRSNSKGKGRRRKMPRQIELIGYNGKFHLVNEDDRFKGSDVIAEEILEGTLPEGVDLEGEFIRRVRNLVS